MITSWKVSNFKSIYSSDDLPLGRLTIFAGANSSGKSTFIQSILLVAQTLSNKVGSRPVILNGALTSLGQFNDVKTAGSNSNRITIRCTCQPLSGATGFRKRVGPIFALSAKLREYSFELSFDADPSSPEKELFQMQPRLASSAINCIFRDEDDNEKEYSIAVKNVGHKNLTKKLNRLHDDGLDELDEHFQSGLKYGVTLDSASMSEVKEDLYSARLIGCTLRHFLPTQILCTVDPIQEEARAIVGSILVSLRGGYYRSTYSARYLRRREVQISSKVLKVLEDLLKDKNIDLKGLIVQRRNRLRSVRHRSYEADKFVSYELLFDTLRSLMRAKRLEVEQALGDEEKLTRRLVSALRKSALSQRTRTVRPTYAPRYVMDSSKDIEDFFSTSVKYLGPLRASPKPLYPLVAVADPDEIGLSGENTASVIEQNKKRKVRYIPSAQFRVSLVKPKLVERSLEDAVIDWLKYLEVAQSVESRDMGKLGHELKVGLANSTGKQDLSHVGVGVSQVLPILVMCLLAKVDSTLVFEQPELHLHPKVQTLLADFFLSMALCKKQCIVETHSEYFIDRLRLLIATAEGNSLIDQTKIYFVEKPRARSNFREVKINEFGAITDWPEGFFDQSQRQAEEILRAAANKRKSFRTNQ